jgi:SAM-dependent methyltransferase
MNDFSSSVFSGGGYIDRFVGTVREILAGKAPARVLDIGCGNGDLLLKLTTRLPGTTFTGVDISSANIAAARTAAQAQGLSDQIDFIVADYMKLPFPAFDLVISYSTLHLIDAATDALFAKISGELRPGGKLVAVIPYDCLYNRALVLLRHCFRALRSPLTDRFIFFIGRLLTRGRVPDPVLWERVIYMYMLPHFYYGSSLRKLLAEQYGLEVVITHREEHASIAQPKHLFVVLRKMK